MVRRHIYGGRPFSNLALSPYENNTINLLAPTTATEHRVSSESPFLIRDCFIFLRGISRIIDGFTHLGGGGNRGAAKAQRRYYSCR